MQRSAARQSCSPTGACSSSDAALPLSSCSAAVLYHQLRPQGACTLSGTLLLSMFTTTPTSPGFSGPLAASATSRHVGLSTTLRRCAQGGGRLRRPGCFGPTIADAARGAACVRHERGATKEAAARACCQPPRPRWRARSPPRWQPRRRLAAAMRTAGGPSSHLAPSPARAAATQMAERPSQQGGLPLRRGGRAGLSRAHRGGGSRCARPAGICVGPQQLLRLRLNPVHPLRNLRGRAAQTRPSHGRRRPGARRVVRARRQLACRSSIASGSKKSGSESTANTSPTSSARLRRIVVRNCTSTSRTRAAEGPLGQRSAAQPSAAQRLLRPSSLGAPGRSRPRR